MRGRTYNKVTIYVELKIIQVLSTVTTCEYKNHCAMATMQSDNDRSHNMSSHQQSEKQMKKDLTPIFRINSVESLTRNRIFLKDLELAKARLRTYAAYTPTDRELQQRVVEYRKYLQKRI